MLHPIDIIDLTSQFTISTLQTKTMTVSLDVNKNHPSNQMSKWQKVDKSKDTIETSYYKYLSHVVENVW